MKIAIAPDKFKGSLTGFEFCDIVAHQIQTILPTAKVVKLPLADGGDGTMEIVNYYLKGEIVSTKVVNPLFKSIKSSYLYAQKSKMAFIEMAEASGIKLLEATELDCKNTTTQGTGELIKDAIKGGAKTIILGVGGSATNDCGIGMATALGYRFLDKKGQEVLPVGKNLSKIKTIDDSKVIFNLQEITFKIACDVTNPLYGKNGAAYVYASQKGATENEVKLLDKGLRDFAKVLESHYQIYPQKIKGAGAAGGMGIASKVFLQGELISGIELIKELANFDKNIQNADWVITGEGKLDKQTLSGKTVLGVLNSIKKQKVAIFCGKNELNKSQIENIKVHYIDELMRLATNTEDAMVNSKLYLQQITQYFIKKVCKKE